MTATSDLLTDGHRDTATTGKINGSEVVLRSLQRIVGASLIVAAASLWVGSGVNLDADVVIMKVGLSALCCTMGYLVALSSLKTAQPEIEIDAARREVRVVHRGMPDFGRPTSVGKGRLIQRCCFSDLNRVERSGRTLSFWDAQGQFLADVHVGDQRALDKLVSGLREAGQTV